MSLLRISCPGSCGELFQCVSRGREMLLSYGINLKTVVEFSRSVQNSSHLNSDKIKIKQALDLLPMLSPMTWTYNTPLSIGKGFSTSTVDMAIFLQGSAFYQNQLLTSQELARLCAQIEPTDSVMFSDWTVLDPLSGDLVWQTDWKPNLYVYVLEPLTQVETILLERMRFCQQYDQKESEELLPWFQTICTSKNLEQLGQLATKSALLNDKRLPKPYLKEILALAASFPCLGINIAHSGSVVGLLLTKEALVCLEELEKAIQKSCFASYYSKRQLCQIVYEGIRYEEVT